MSKRKWRNISNKPHRLLIAVVGIASIMGVSYASFSDQLVISPSITVELPDKPDEPPADNKIAGNIMVGSGNYIQYGLSSCIHAEEGKPCPGNTDCPHKGGGKGLAIREPILMPYTIEGGITGVQGEATFIIREKVPTGPGKEQKITSTFSNAYTDIQILKENGEYLKVDHDNTVNRELVKDSTYVLEIDVGKYNTGVGNISTELITALRSYLNDAEGKPIPAGSIIDDLEVEATISYQLTFADGSHLCSENGEKRFHDDPDCKAKVVRTQILSIIKSPEYTNRNMQGSASSGIYIAPPGVSFLPEFPAPPDTNLPTILPEFPVPPDMDATEAPDINLPTTVPDVTNPSDIHTPSVLPEAPVLPEGNGTVTPEVPALPEGNTSETPEVPAPPESSTEATPDIEVPTTVPEVPAPPESSTEATPDVEVPTTTPEVSAPPESSSSQTPDVDMPTTMPDVTTPPSQGEESSPDSPQESLISD